MKRTDITALFPEATDDQIKAIMDLNGADINKAKEGVDALRSQLNTAQADLEALKARPGEASEKLSTVQKELDDLKAANALRDLKVKISKETGVPEDLLTQTDEASLKAQADAIKEYAKPGGYPNIRDGGEVHGSGNTATRDKFAEWFKTAVN